MKVVKQNKARVLQQRGEQWSKFMRESNLTIRGRCHLFAVMDEQGTLFNEFWLMCENPQVNPAPGRNVLKPLHSPRGLPKWSFWCLHVPCWKSQQKNTDVGLSARGTPLPKHEHLGSDCKMRDSTPLYSNTLYLEKYSGVQLVHWLPTILSSQVHQNCQMVDRCVKFQRRKGGQWKIAA